MTIVQTIIGSFGGAEELTSLTFVTSVEGSALNNTPTLTIPATSQAGDVAIFSFVTDNGAQSGTSSDPSGWTEVGNNFGGTEYPEGSSYMKILSSGDPGTSVSATLVTSDDWTAICSVYRPNTPATNITAYSFVSADGPSALGPLTITSSGGNGSAVIVYGYAAGRPPNQNPSETMSPAPDAYITGGASNSDIAYKLYSTTDTAVNHTWSTTDSGRQAAHGFYIVVS